MSNLPQIKQMANSPALRGRIASLVENSESFIQSVIVACSSSDYLLSCTPESIWNVAVKAAILKLPVDPELGQAYIVPFKGTATFQLGWRGLVQLALRSGMYSRINVTNIYRDEIERYDPIEEEITFKEGYNANAERFRKGSTPVGYYAWFRLKNGFEAKRFITRGQAEAHAKEYSQAYKYDLRKGYKKSLWSTDFDSMGRKTVLKMVLKQFGYLSTEIQNAWENEAIEMETPETVPVQPQQPQNDVTPYANVEHPQGNQPVQQPINDQQFPEDPF